MGRLNGRDQSFKRHRGIHRIARAREGLRSSSITLAALTQSSRESQKEPERRLRSTAMSAVRCDGISRFVCSEPTQNLPGSPRVSGRFHCQKRFKGSDQVPTVAPVPKV
jgi:hypothetical protein